PLSLLSCLPFSLLLFILNYKMFLRPINIREQSKEEVAWGDEKWKDSVSAVSEEIHVPHVLKPHDNHPYEINKTPAATFATSSLTQCTFGNLLCHIIGLAIQVCQQIIIAPALYYKNFS
ncbi:hypothetical protein ACJX0J_023588, partial [Zea mays]